MPEEFYVGYQDAMPEALRRFLIRMVLIGVALLAGVLGGVAFVQEDVGGGIFEFGVIRVFEGRVYADPVPMLIVDGNMPDSEGIPYVLVGTGKHGVGDWVREHAGRRVRLSGTRIERDAQRMIEVVDPSRLEVLDFERMTAPDATDLGEVVLVGELVDTKCYLGVMRPAVGKVHRACAARCLSGGVPPGLLVRESEAVSRVIHLVPSGKGQRRLDPQLAARRLEVKGRLRAVKGVATLEMSAWRTVD